jgi:hypothetical protein
LHVQISKPIIMDEGVEGRARELQLQNNNKTG